MYVCVVVCLGWGWEGVIVSYKLTQKHVSPYRMVSVYVRVGSFRMQINDRLHDINNMGPVMQLSSAEVSRLSVHQLDFHTQLEEGSGGGSQNPVRCVVLWGCHIQRANGAECWCHNPLSTASPYVCVAFFHIEKTERLELHC